MREMWKRKRAARVKGAISTNMRIRIHIARMDSGRRIITDMGTVIVTVMVIVMATSILRDGRPVEMKMTRMRGFCSTIIIMTGTSATERR